MSTFAENINQICKLKGTKLTTLVKGCGYSSSKTTAINRGSIPSEKQLIKFAEKLNCSVKDFFADTTSERNDYYSNEEKLLVEGYRNMPNSHKHKLLAYFYELLELEKE
ncbi:hypothetical protein SAMN05216249_1113 [Acetitomaculum ruminis DSM 5522]|uniref:Cro/C1-type HTH DNA-binding domain-containing protein n=1 Tax=Acetitomaculum ruminis DSM 5522 TaxID=1120918 RepID=A0A1I0YTC7_9FIRM|nr:hypothetical protein [Acetitomaculum ruminis]SFB15363.1 hypothetical protein SAMN05216249_1113 [Acetitomaculum ruminis DSM 5522]